MIKVPRDIEGDIHASANEKIQWVNTGTYISGTDTALTIDADDTLNNNADTTMTLIGSNIHGGLMLAMDCSWGLMGPAAQTQVGH